MVSKFKRMYLAAGLMSLLAGGGSSAWAQGTVDKRQDNQAERIASGTASGQLTPREQRRLNQEQARIARGEERAAADGVVTRKEKARMHARQRHANAHIGHAKHDRQQLPN